MDDLIKALTVPFVAGFIVQRFLEIIDPVIADWFKNPNTKKIWLGLISLGIGCALSGFADLRIFHSLHPLFPDSRELPWILDVFFTGIFISAGTEGFNSLLKFANYKKEASKADASVKLKSAGPDAIKVVNPQR